MHTLSHIHSRAYTHAHTYICTHKHAHTENSSLITVVFFQAKATVITAGARYMSFKMSPTSATTFPCSRCSWGPGTDWQAWTSMH